MTIEFGDYDPLDSVSASDALPVPYAVIWLDGLANILRAAGLKVIEVGGWERRSRRNNSGYSRHPTHVMIHHTASSTSAGNDVNYMTYNSPDKPIANIYIARNGDIHLMAGGPTNTNGSGRDWWGGGVPANDMNAEAVGIEIGNDGTGEPYPEPQVESVLRVCVELLKAGGVGPGNVRSHWEWCRDTGRKIDPRGPSKYEDPALGGKWNMDRFRGDVFQRMNPPVTPDPPLQGVPDVFFPIKPLRNSDTRPFGAPVSPGNRVFGLQAAIPANATAVALNVTALDAAGAGFVTVWPGGSRPDTSCVNYPSGLSATNGSIVVGVNNHGFSIYNHTTCHLIVDVTGYWTP